MAVLEARTSPREGSGSVTFQPLHTAAAPICWLGSKAQLLSRVRSTALHLQGLGPSHIKILHRSVI